MQTENEEIEAEIHILQSALDAEVESVSRCSTPMTREGSLTEGFTNKSLLKVSSSLDLAKVRTPGRIRTSASSKSLPVENVHRNDTSTLLLNTSKKLSMNAVEGKDNKDTDMINTARGNMKSSRSRVRSKIQDARDEKYLSELDFIES